VLSTLSGAVNNCPVPFLSLAASASLSLVTALNQTKENKEDFKELAANACNLISSVIIAQQRRTEQGRALPPNLGENLQILVDKLEPITKFVEKQNKRNVVSRFVLSSKDAKKLQDYKEALNNALAHFQMKSSINVETGVSDMADQMAHLVAAFERIGNFPEPEPHHEGMNWH